MALKRRVNKRLSLALGDRELAKDSNAKIINASGKLLKPLRPFTSEEREIYKALIGEIVSGRPNKDSITAACLDLDAPEANESYVRGEKITWQAVNTYYQPISRGQYLEQEADAFKRDVTTNWTQVPLIVQGEDGNEIDLSESNDFSSKSKSNLSPLRQLACDIITYKFDQLGKEACINEINHTYETLSTKKYVNKADLDIWKQNCLDAIRKIVSAKNHWKKLQ